MNDVRLMAHLVAGYPDMETTRRIARALVRGGADSLEVQFPFSDPSADGPLIERASQTALENGFKVSDGFALMKELGELNAPLFIMTYGSLVFSRGVDRFCEDAASAGVRGLVIPDLPPDYSEGLFDAGKKHGVAIVPVIAPEISAERLALIGGLKPEYIYTALRLGITGSRTKLDEGTIAYLDRVRALGAKIIAGFGVRTREQMVALAGHADEAAVGSHFLEAFNASGNPDVLEAAARTLRKG